ncbi:MAG: YCF48-related protein [Candidatus Omnitrophota bacterium]
MKKNIAVALLIGLFTLALGFKVFAEDIAWNNIGREHLNLRIVLVDIDNPRTIYIGSREGIFKTQDGGDSWRNILVVKGQNRSVNFLLSDSYGTNYLYAATGGGLFCSHNKGGSWKKIFQGKNYLENECTAIAVLSNTVYLGTKAGLFVSKDKGRSWQRQGGGLAKSAVLAITYHSREENYVYIACVDGIFRTQDGAQSWERIFVTKPVEPGDENNIEQGLEDDNEEERFSRIRYIVIDPINLDHLYLATSRGIYKSQDRGNTWESVTSYGLLSQDINFLLFSDKSQLYAVTKSGIFKYVLKRWQELSFGLAATDITQIILDSWNDLYAACDKGLFKANMLFSSHDTQNKTILLYSANEPKINEVQQAAIEYAEVEPGKIMRWRRQVAKKALLPKVSVGLDRNVTDLWHWEGGSTTKTDDDILRRGRDSIEWDIALSWDLGELIWSDDQTSIDVRSRLMVQLRDDILDEVTRLYFERIRLKREIDDLSIEDRKKRFEKELKLEELTASLDALTGGYFSRQIIKDKI